MKNRNFLFCQYADDVRQEIGNKLTLVGVYQGGLEIRGSAPIALPKLVVVANLSTLRKYVRESTKIDVDWNGSGLISVSAPQDLVNKALSDTTKKDDDPVHIQLIVAIQPFNVDGDGKLEVSAHLDGEKIIGNALAVKMVPAVTQ